MPLTIPLYAFGRGEAGSWIECIACTHGIHVLAMVHDQRMLRWADRRRARDLPGVALFYICTIEVLQFLFLHVVLRYDLQHE